MILEEGIEDLGSTGMMIGILLQGEMMTDPLGEMMTEELLPGETRIGAEMTTEEHLPGEMMIGEDMKKGAKMMIEELQLKL